MTDDVVLVDENDREIGAAPKLDAHRDGLLHRAVSVFLFRPDGALLLQRRSSSKYHSPALWSNTCCGHPRPGEATGTAALRRLREELGIGATLAAHGTYRYRTEVPGGLIENEMDHLFSGEFSGNPLPNPAEVDGWRWVHGSDLQAELSACPEAFTAWSRALLPLAWDLRAARSVRWRDARS